MIDTEFENFYHKKTTYHKVDVFHAITLYRFMHVCCEKCKLQSQCESITHKQCKVSQSVEKTLEPFISAKVSGFIGEEFYIKPNGKKQEMERKIKSILREYTYKQNERQ